MIMSIKNLSKSFYQGETEIKALQSVSFSFEKQGSLAIVGPSGSGKTTLLSLLTGLETPSQGDIHLGSSQISSMSEAELTQFRSQNIGIVFQQFHLMPHLTAIENVGLPLEILGESHIEKRATEILEKVGLGSRIDHLPHQLSGGECQRVAIARASVVKPQFLFADEPSGNLDTATGEKVMDLLFDLTVQEKMNLILVTHDSNLAKRCDQTIQLHGGQLQ